jgi:hypothetical protein
MVPWYHPPQLLETARLTVLSLIFGDRADFRLHEAGRGPEAPVDYGAGAGGQGAFWLDYTADLGDGFDSTYSIARLLAAPSLTPSPLAGESAEPLPRGRVLVLGGDEVYPTPDDDAYVRRFLDPYERALPVPDSATLPDLYALPGNHDWYDGLTSFLKVFCRRERIGGWRTPQLRSYFALQLPHRWWLFGLDTQLYGDLDEPQFSYFCGQPVGAGDRIILCAPEPHWTGANIFECSARLPNNIVRLLDHLTTLGASVPLQIAGDTHHYRRHSWPPPHHGGAAASAAGHAPPSGTRHLVTSGGGGAFLHPTHTRPQNSRCAFLGQRGWKRWRCKLTFCRASSQRARCLGVRYGRPSAPGAQAHAFPLVAEYPSAARSWAATWGNLLFPLHNPGFGAVTAVLYLLLSWLMPSPQMAGWNAGPSAEVLGRTLLVGATALVAEPTRLLLFLVVLFGFWAFTDTHRPLYRLVGSLLHGGAHLAAALVVTAGVVWLDPHPSRWLCGLGPASWRQVCAPIEPVADRLGQWAGILLGGYLLGAALMGLYLWISCAIFGRHGNEAFSALRIADLKHFLRLRIEAEALTVHVVAVERVSRWRLRRGVAVEALAGSAPAIIDRFVVPTAPAAPAPAAPSPG